MVDGLELRQKKFIHGMYLPAAQVYSIRIFDCQFGSVTGLNLESAIVKNQIQIHDSQFNLLKMVACQADNIFLNTITVEGEFDARGVVAEKTLNFHKVEARGTATFRDSHFGSSRGGSVVIGQFQRRADFTNTQFAGGVQFGSSEDHNRCHFYREAIFDDSTFGSEAAGSLTMPGCAFEAKASFRNATVHSCASFDGVAFQSTVDLDGLRVLKGPRGEAQLTMRKPVFGATVTMRVEVQGTAKLEDVSLSNVAEGFTISALGGIRFSRVDIEPFSVIALSSANSVVVDQVQMQNGGQLKIAAKQFELTNFSSAHPALIQNSATSKDGTLLTSLSGTNCDGLTFSGLDLSHTKFIGAANVDRLVVSGQFTLNSTSGWHARRKYLFEEAMVRTPASSSKQWKLNSAEGEHTTLSSIEPRELAAVYRSLRKGREDQKDEPGSADFYYGEMEMRRLSLPTVSVERLVLTLYWVVSGYGLRAWRALLALTLLITGAAFALCSVPLLNGDTHGPGLGKAFLFSAQAGLSLAGPASSYSTTAQVIQLILRISLPVLIALAVLAVRARVKR